MCVLIPGWLVTMIESVKWKANLDVERTGDRTAGRGIASL